jgi:hypothetical protein
MARVLGELQTLDAAPINSDALAQALQTLLPEWLGHEDHDSAVAIEGSGVFG